MDEDSKTNNAIKLPTFSGKDRDFNVWWIRFNAYCTMKKIELALEENFDLPDDPKNITGTDDEKKEAKKSIAVNSSAVACLTVAFTTSQLIEYCTESQTDKYPGGIAKEIVKKLLNRYRPNDVVAGVEAELELANLRFKTGRHPDEYFTKLSVLRSQYKGSKTFDKKIPDRKHCCQGTSNVPCNTYCRDAYQR